MAAVNNINAGNEAAFVTAGESVTSRLDDIAKKVLKGRSKTQDTAAALPPGYLPAERSMQRLAMSLQGGSAKHSQNQVRSVLPALTAEGVGPAGVLEGGENRKPARTSAVGPSAKNLARYEHNPVLPTALPTVLPTVLASKDSSGVIISSPERHVKSNKEAGTQQPTKDNEMKPHGIPSSESDRPHEQLSARENIRPHLVNTHLPNAEHTAKDINPGKTLSHARMSSDLLASAASEHPANKTQASGRLTYTFSDWGRGHQVNVQMAAHNGTPVVLHPSDSLVQQRLADHSEHHHQGNPEWVFQDEQEKQHPGQHRQSDADEEQA